LDYLVPNDIVRAVPHYKITGLAAVPSLWHKLAELNWPAVPQLRYLTNSGGTLPLSTIQSLQHALPNTALFLMYGLTEAFRSTYLPPEQLKIRPNSIGKAIPNAQLMLLNAEGEECGVDEPGELVHRGALVAKGYWNNPQATTARFKPLPEQPIGLSQPEIAVWSGDLMRRDADGFLYFLGRRDAQIKTAGYRVSPDEIESVVIDLPEVTLAVAQGVPHPQLGQAIVLWVQATCQVTVVQRYCRTHLANFMQPCDYIVLSEMPLTMNGKPDRTALLDEYLQTTLTEPVV
jgi:acyl-CoA synthetase (AMP-forming)/AMP-acid ligase II